jgi:hypothetical protein
MKLTLTAEEVADVLQVLDEHQSNYGLEHTPERIIRIRGIINKLNGEHK